MRRIILNSLLLLSFIALGTICVTVADSDTGQFKGLKSYLSRAGDAGITCTSMASPAVFTCRVRRTSQ